MTHDEETARLTLTEWSIGWNKGRRPEEESWFLQDIFNLENEEILCSVSLLTSEQFLIGSIGAR